MNDLPNGVQMLFTANLLNVNAFLTSPAFSGTSPFLWLSSDNLSLHNDYTL